MPAIFDPTTGEFLEPIDSHQNKLLKIVMRKHCIYATFDANNEPMATTANTDYLLNRTLKKK